MNEVIASPAAAPSLAIARPSLPGGMGAQLSRVRAMWDQPAVKRARPAIMLLTLLAVGFLVWSVFATPAQRDISRGMADADKAAVADALGAANIKYHIDGDSGAVSVADGDYYRAKMLLASQGLPKAPPSASDTLASLPMGASRAVEGERLLDAREADLARTIETIDAVASAKVHLAAEQPSVFLREEKAPAASVMLKLQPGRTLTQQQVQAIASLVASSVPGLAPESVSIVDQAGHLLSRGNGDPATAASDRQVELQSEVEQRYSEALDRLLIPLLGAGNYTAQVHADLDFSEVQATRESYPKDTQAVRQENGGWTKDGGPDGPAVGIPGALSNTPPPASTLTATNPAQPQTPPAAGQPGQPAANGQAPNPAAGPGTSFAANAANRTTENYTRTYELGHEVSVTKNGVGGVKRLSVAVAIAEGTGKAKRSPADIAAIEKLVRGAVGADQARGDQVAVSARPFVAADASTTATHWYQAEWVPLVARNLSALLVAALVVFGVARPLLKRRAAAVPEAAKGASPKAELGKQIAGEIGQQRAQAGGDVTLDMIEGAPGYETRAALIRDFVKQDPARAALVVRDLIRADAKENADG